MDGGVFWPRKNMNAQQPTYERPWSCPSCAATFETQRGVSIHHVHEHNERLLEPQDARIPLSDQTRGELSQHRLNGERWSAFLKRLVKFAKYKRGEVERPWRSSGVLETLYWEQDHTLSEIGDILGVGTSTVREQMIRMGIPRRPRVSGVEDDPKELHRLRVVEDKSLRQIADELGVSHTTVQKRLESHDIAEDTELVNQPWSGEVRED